MKARLLYILIFAAWLATASCSREKPMNIDPDTLNPEGTGQHDQSAVDFSGELADDEPRFTIPGLSMRYNDGGIIVSRSDIGEAVTFKFVDLAEGNTVELSLNLSSPAQARMTVNDIEMPTAGCTVERDDPSGLWLNIAFPDKSHGVVMIPTL